VSIRLFIEQVRATLHASFDEIDHWFEKEPGLRAYRPSSGGWTIDEILEHIGLTSHFLLIIIDKGVQKAQKRSAAEDFAGEALQYIPQLDRLSEVGIHRSFPWIRPEHMEPHGRRSSAEVRKQLSDQLHRCFEHLNAIPNGEGVLVRTTMTVNELGKLDVYEYIFFLAQHARRHVAQMQRNETEFRALLLA